MYAFECWISFTIYNDIFSRYIIITDYLGNGEDIKNSLELNEHLRHNLGVNILLKYY